jgi:hypothetical protein
MKKTIYPMKNSYQPYLEDQATNYANSNPSNSNYTPKEKRAVENQMSYVVEWQIHN